MKHLPLILLLFIISSCQIGHFDRYPGKALTKIPKKLQGTYKYQLFKSSDDSSRMVMSSDYLIASNKEDENDTLRFNDTTVFSQYKNLYFLFSKTKEENYTWTGFCFWPEGKNLKLIPVFQPDKKDTENKRLDDFLSIHDTYLEKKDGIVDTVNVYKMDEPQLLKYLEYINSGEQKGLILMVKDKP